jgi:hypothetical protein
MIDLLSIPSSNIRLSKNFFLDLDWWRSFISVWNGISMLVETPHCPTISITTDASLLGYGIICGRQWISAEWSISQLAAAKRAKATSSTFLEMLAVAIAVFTFCPGHAGKDISLFCDNAAVVCACNIGVCKNSHLMSLIRDIFFCTARYQFRLRLTHLSGTSNIFADSLSRLQVQHFKRLFPDCDRSPTIPSLPPSLILLNQLK